MKKKYHIIIMFFLVFLLCGCTANYDITITNNLSIIESLKIDGGSTKKACSNMIFSVIADYGNIYNISPLEESGGCLDDECDPNATHYSCGVIASKTYKDLNEYSKSYILREYFGEITIDKKINTYTLNGKYSSNFLAIIKDVGNIESPFDKLIISICLPFHVISHNANERNGNCYSWIYSKDDYDKKIELEFDTNKKVDYNGNVNSNNDNDNATTETNNSNNITKYILWSIVIFIIAVIIIYIVSRKDENNRI